MNALPPVPSLGVGLTYRPGLRTFIEDNLELLDYVQVAPDRLWTDCGRRASPRHAGERNAAAWLGRIARRIPLVPHGTGLSIGCADGFRHEHVARLRCWYGRLGFPWYGDRLAFGPGLAMPVPRDRESLDALVPRARKVAATVPVPLAIENDVYIAGLAGEGIDPAEFLNRLCARANCYLVLNLHNLYANCRYYGADPMDTLARLDLDRIIEIHVVGGVARRTHCPKWPPGATPGPVLDLLRYALLSCPNVGGVTFDVPGSWFEVMGPAVLKDELDKLRVLWHRYQPLPSRLAS